MDDTIGFMTSDIVNQMANENTKKTVKKTIDILGELGLTEYDLARMKKLAMDKMNEKKPKNKYFDDDYIKRGYLIKKTTVAYIENYASEMRMNLTETFNLILEEWIDIKEKQKQTKA